MSASSSLCEVCGNKKGGKLIACNYCSDSYHLYCLTPTLKARPEGDWYCPSCEQLRHTDKLYRECALVEVQWPECGLQYGEVQGVRKRDDPDSDEDEVPDGAVEHLVWYKAGDEQWHNLSKEIAAGEARVLEVDVAPTALRQSDELLTSRAHVSVYHEQVKSECGKTLVFEGYYDGDVSAIRVQPADSPFEPGRTLHLIKYDAGDRHWVDLERRRWKRVVGAPNMAPKLGKAKLLNMAPKLLQTGHKTSATTGPSSASAARAAAAAAAAVAAEEKRVRDAERFARAEREQQLQREQAAELGVNLGSSDDEIDPAERSATAAAKLSTALSVDCGCGSTWLEVQFGTSYTSELRALAREIEAAVRAIVGSPLTKEYAKKVRSLEANLALEDNGALRQRVLSRELPATALVQMEHAKLAPLGQQEEISNRLKAIKRSVTIEGDDVTQVYAFGSLVRVRSKSDPEDEIGGSPDGEIGPRLEFAPISDSSATSSAHKRMRSASPRPER